MRSFVAGYSVGGGDREAGSQENKVREGYGRRERKGREVVEIGGNYATLHNISQSKKGENEETKKKGRDPGGLDPPVPPPYSDDSPTRSFQENRFITCEMQGRIQNLDAREAFSNGTRTQ